MRNRIIMKPGRVSSSTGFVAAKLHDSERAKAILNELENANPEGVKDTNMVGFMYTLTHLKQNIKPKYMRVFGTWMRIPVFYTLEDLVYWKEYVKL